VPGFHLISTEADLQDAYAQVPGAIAEIIESDTGVPTEVELENSYSEYLAKLPDGMRPSVGHYSVKRAAKSTAMISPRSPDSDLISVTSIEDRLIELKCTKKTHGTKHTCLWTAPNGRAFHAPNLAVYSLVPADTMESVLDRYSDVMKLPAIH